MRIALIAEVFLPKIDGVTLRTRNLIRHLLDEGDDVLVLTPQTDGREPTNVPVHQSPSFPLARYPEYHIGLPDASLVEAVRAFEPDVIHYLNPFAFGFRCWDLLDAACPAVPTVASFHTLYPEFAAVEKEGVAAKLLWRLMRHYHNRADRNLTVSGVMLNELRSRGFQRVELWPPAVDCELFHPSKASTAMRERLTGGESARPLLLTVSRLAPEKNVAFLAGVMRHVPDARLAVVGDGPSRDELQEAFAGTDTKFVGYLKGEELAEAYASTDAFVYASETETMGNVVLEAMASGCPVIAPKAGGIASLIRHDETGLFFTPDATDAAVAAVRSVLDNDAMRERLSVAARLAVEEWGWDRAVTAVRKHYQETLAAGPRNQRSSGIRKRLASLTTRALVTAFRLTSRCAGHKVGERHPSTIPVAPTSQRPLALDVARRSGARSAERSAV